MISEGHEVQSLAQSRPNFKCRLGCSGLCPAEFQIFPGYSAMPLGKLVPVPSLGTFFFSFYSQDTISFSTIFLFPPSEKIPTLSSPLGS